MRDALKAAAALLLLAACSNEIASTTEARPSSDSLKADNAPAEALDDVKTAPEGPAFDCFGAEPFWSAKINGGAVTVRSPLLTEPAGVIFSGEWEDASNEDSLAWKATNDGRILTVKRERCVADSGNEYDYKTNAAALLPGAESAEGCCSLSEMGK